MNELDEAKDFVGNLEVMHMAPDELAHYGVLGMKWGRRKDDNGNYPSKGSETSLYKLTSEEKQVLKSAGLSEKDSARLQAKHGPDQAKKKLTEQQKEALIAAGWGLAAVAAYGGIVLYGRHLMGPKALQAFVAASNLAKQSKALGLLADDVAKFGTKAVDLPAGKILKRVSMDVEKTIRPQGFFAAHLDSDVERYKAVLPIYWKMWAPGLGKTPAQAASGHVINLKAKAAIKAPSERETFDMFKEFLTQEVEVRGIPSSYLKASGYSDSVSPEQLDRYAMKLFPQFTETWMDSNAKYATAFFNKTKDRGYNALIDMNDAGSLGEQPLRLLDSSIFDIVGTEGLPSSAIKEAQKKVTQLSHEGVSMNELDEAKDFVGNLEVMHMAPDELAHYGVLGMKWGRRKDADGNYPPKQPRKVQIDGSKRKYRPSSSSDFIESRELLTKPKYELSTKEIDKIIDRLQKEQRVSQLNPNAVQKGKIEVDKLVAIVGTAGAVYGLSKTPLGKKTIGAVKKLIKK